MKNYHALFIIIIAILLVGGGVLVYNDLIKPSVPKNVVNNQENQNINNETAKLTVKDCGLIEDIDAVDMFASNPLANTSSQTKVSLKCMDNALINCQTAKIRLVSKKEGEGMYEIKGKENQNCLLAISSVLNNAANKICKVPQELISALKTEINKNPNSEGTITLSLSFAISMLEMFKQPGGTATSEGTDIDCVWQ